MFTNEEYRTYLLGMADEKLESGIEEGILGGQIDPGDLEQVEEDLIDDLVFERLSEQEERSFRDSYLSTAQGAGKLVFARGLRKYAAEHRSKQKLRPGSVNLRKNPALRWTWALAATLGCVVLTVVWLGGRSLRLSHQLAQAARENDQQQRMIASLRQEEGRSTSASSEQALPQPVLRLSPGVSRGLTTVPVLLLDRGANTATIVLELPFEPGEQLAEELLNSDNKSIWSQHFSVAGAVSREGTTTIMLPASILVDGDYRLRATSGSLGGEPESAATYLFRIRQTHHD